MEQAIVNMVLGVEDMVMKVIVVGIGVGLACLLLKGVLRRFM